MIPPRRPDPAGRRRQWWRFALRKVASSAVIACLGLAGCAWLQPRSAQWQDQYVRIYRGVSIDEALDAADRVFRLADRDFRVERRDGALSATRAYPLISGMATQNGYDRWSVTATRQADGATRVETRIVREADVDVLLPVVGGSRAAGGTMPSTPAADKPLTAVFAYRLFYARLDRLLLGRSVPWLTCADAKKVLGPDRTGANALCARTAQDHAAEGDE